MLLPPPSMPALGGEEASSGTLSARLSLFRLPSLRSLPGNIIYRLMVGSQSIESADEAGSGFEYRIIIICKQPYRGFRSDEREVLMEKGAEILRASRYEDLRSGLCVSTVKCKCRTYLRCCKLQTATSTAYSGRMMMQNISYRRPFSGCARSQSSSVLPSAPLRGANLRGAARAQPSTTEAADDWTKSLTSGIFTGVVAVSFLMMPASEWLRQRP
jgi:hypothetical protein